MICEGNMSICKFNTIHKTGQNPTFIEGIDNVGDRRFQSVTLKSLNRKFIPFSKSRILPRFMYKNKYYTEPKVVFGLKNSV